MVLAMAAPFLVAVVLALGAGPAAARLPPATATRMLCATALTVSLTCGLVLCGAAVLGMSQLEPVAEAGHWSTSMPGNEVGPTAGILAGAAALLLFGCGAARGINAVRAALSARKVVQALPTSAAALVVVEDEAPLAYAVGGRIVVSTSMLRALRPDERRALLAHEHAHLQHHHHLYAAIVDVAAAANPFARPAARAVRRSLERWADEVAAVEVGDRRAVALGVAHAALARAHFRARTSPVPVAAALGADHGDVPARVQAMLAPSRAPHFRLCAVLVGASAVCWLASGAIVVWTHAVLELAQTVAGH